LCNIDFGCREANMQDFLQLAMHEKREIPIMFKNNSAIIRFPLMTKVVL